MRRVRAEAQEQLPMEMSHMDDRIRQLSRQLKVAEDMLRVFDVGASSTLVSTVASVDSTIEEVVRVHVTRVRAEAQEQLAMETSSRDDHITQLSSQSKDAENKLRVLEAVASSPFVSTIFAPACIEPYTNHQCRTYSVACAY